MKSPYVLESLNATSVAKIVEEMIPIIATSTRSDVIEAISKCQKKESNPRAASILQMMLDNDEIARRDGIAICQDTGSVWVRLEVGSDLNVPSDIFSKVDDAVARAYEKAKLRKSILKDALVDRTNTNDNTPAFCELAFRDSSGATLSVMLKGGGSDNASRLIMLPPGAGYEGICEEVIRCVKEKGSSACPPLILGIGVGSTFDKVAGLAKKALLREVGVSSKNPRVAELEADLFEKVNATGVGPAGLGGDTTALSVAIETAPCHIAALPLAINMGCCAMRSASAQLVVK